LPSKIKFLAWALLIALTVSARAQQKKTAPSRPGPAPQIAGSFIDTDGKQRLTLQYRRNSQPEVFTGTIHSTCMLPADSTSGESKPLDLSTIPLGTQMTVYYVRHVVGKQSQNVILTLRFDHVRRGSVLPIGVYVSCFKAAKGASPKG